jgi:hypothetical protein
METDPVSETPSSTKISQQKINYNMMANVQQIKKNLCVILGRGGVFTLASEFKFSSKMEVLNEKKC